MMITMDLTQDEQLVLNEYRMAKALPAARLYMILKKGVLEKLDVTAQKTEEQLSSLYSVHRLKEKAT